MNQMTLFIVGLLNEWQREREEGWGAYIIVNSAIYNFFFFLFFYFFFQPHIVAKIKE